MGAGHAHKLYVHGHSVVHRLPGQVKIVALLAFVLVVVATPREAFLAFGLYFLALVAVAAIAGLRPGFVARRMLIELPFVVFALLMPFIAHGQQVEVLGVWVSEPGLLAAWGLLAKGTLGVLASVILGATTEPRDVIVGLQRLRVPTVMVQIMSFMIRYADVVGEDMKRMKVARASRGFDARGLRQLPVVAHAAGALFIRSYERGERVHLAMLSRGYHGSLPLAGTTAASALDWVRGAVLPVVAMSVLLAVMLWP
jgi:cobalt/nickel transport system permease protein